MPTIPARAADIPAARDALDRGQQASPAIRLPGGSAVTGHDSKAVGRDHGPVDVEGARSWADRSSRIRS